MTGALRRGVIRALGPLALRWVGGPLGCGDDFPSARPGGLVQRLARAELVRRYYAASDGEIRRLNRERFWGGEAGRQWHRAKMSYRQTAGGQADEARWRAALVGHLDDLLTARPGLCRLIEVGAGTGEFLVQLAARYPSLREIVGLDLSAAQVADARSAWPASRARFEHAEAAEWLMNHPQPGWVIVGYGTFEYFTQRELDELLRTVAALPRPVSVAIADTVDMDLSTNRDSRPRGELAYSHHYAHRLREAGFTVLAETHTPADARRPDYAQSTVVGILT
jgi:2-polyprenyl-3-methyl-5-hydroxy-6-metoxy-1,4-benzoquinol methylase